MPDIMRTIVPGMNARIRQHMRRTRNSHMDTTLKAATNAVCELAADELDAIPGAGLAVLSTGAPGSGTQAEARRTVTMFLRRVWRDGALFGN